MGRILRNPMGMLLASLWARDLYLRHTHRGTVF